MLRVNRHFSLSHLTKVFLLFFIVLLLCENIHADITSEYSYTIPSTDNKVPRGGSKLYYVTVSGVPSNAVLTNVEAKFDYIAYNGVQIYVSCRFNRGSDPGSTGGVVLVSQGSLPSSPTNGTPGTYGYNVNTQFSNWNGQGVNTTYYFRFSMANVGAYDPTINKIYVRVTYRTPPDAPTLYSPNDYSVRYNQTPHSFDWNDVPGATNYRIYVDNNSGFGTPEINQETSSSQFSSYTSLPNNVYYWQVQAYNSAGWGSWSATRQFVVDTPPPSPSLSLPANGSQFNQGDSTTFSWSGPTGYSINRYYLRVVQGTDLNASPKYYRELSSTSEPVSLAGWVPGTYTWAVRAIKNAPSGYNQSNYEIAIGWGTYATRTFTINTPLPPQLTNPTNGSTVSVGSNITFNWGTSQGAGRYRLKICTNSAMSTCINNGNPFEPPSGQTSYTVLSSYFTAGSTYYWQVGAIAPGDVGGWGNYGPTPAWSFIVDKPLPPNLISPVNGASLSVGNDITFSWGTSQGAGRYRLKICTNSTMSTCINSGNPFEPPLGQTSYTVSASYFAAGNTYYWQVGAIAPGDIGGWGNYGPTPAWSFNITNPPVSLISPANNTTITNKDITFQWSPVSGAVSYEIFVDNNSGFGSQELNEIYTSAITSRTITNHLPDNIYYWKVKVNFADGSYSWSDTWQFTYYLPSYQEPVWVPLYRLYNSSIKDHYYTTIESQRDDAVQNSNYTYEKIECYVSDRKFNSSNVGYLFHLYHSGLNNHFYTTDDVERNNKIIAGYRYEGITGFLYTTPTEGASPLMYLKHDANTDNFYTISKYESDNAVNPPFNFTLVGIIGYVSPTGLKDPLAHVRPQANFGGIDLGSGAYRGLNSVDLSMIGRGPSLVFAHYYNSFNFNTHPMGEGWSHSLDSSITEDSNGDVVYVSWGNGSVSRFTKNQSGGFTDEAGNHDILTFVPDPANYGYDLKRKDQSLYKYRRFDVYPYGKNKIVLLSVEDWAGNKLTFDYQNVTTVSDQLGRSLRLSYYYPSGQLQKVEEVVSGVVKRSISFTYNPRGLLDTFVDANGETTRYDYYNEPDTLRHNLLKSITYPKGNTIIINYDAANGKVNSVKDNNSTKETSVSYTPQSNLTTVTDPENNIHQYLHPGGLLNAYKGSNDSAWTTIERTDTINNPFLPTKVTDKRGNSTYYEYDAMGNLIKVTNARGMTATYNYNDKNNIVDSREFYNPNGTIPSPTIYSYDLNNNRLRTISKPEGDSIQLNYYANYIGQVEYITDGRGYSTQYIYDAYGNLWRVIDAETNMTIYENDYAGRTVSLTDADNIKTVYTYDANDNPKDIINYTKNGLNVFRTINRLYDKNGNLDTVGWINQGTSSQTRYTYDNQDRLESVINPASISKIYTFYETGLVKIRKDYNNSTSNYYYDDHNRLQRTAYPDQSEITISRDENGNITSVSSPQGPSGFTYNNLNLIETYTDPYNQTVRYDYNDAGRLWKLTYPGNKVVTYTYDQDGRLKTVRDWIDSANGTATTYIYDTAGNLKEIQRPNNTKAVYTYDRASRLTGITEQKSDGTIIASYVYELSGVGDHNTETANEPLSLTITPRNVTYTNNNQSNRLVSAGSISYTYDNNGNRKTKSDSGINTTYSYDYENMLTNISATGQANIQHVYDGMNNRIAKVLGGVTTRYVLDLSGDMSRVLVETDGSGNVIAYYIYGQELISRIDPAGNRRFYHFDNRGDTVALTDASQNITDAYAYDEYGKVQNASANTTPNPFKFIGQHGVMNEGNNLYFMRARFYDAEVGRFLSEDPLGFEGGDWNLYAYVGGNPVTGIDANGLEGNNIAGSTPMTVKKKNGRIWRAFKKSVKETGYFGCYLVSLGNFCEGKVDYYSKLGANAGKDFISLFPQAKLVESVSDDAIKVIKLFSGNYSIEALFKDGMKEAAKITYKEIKGKDIPLSNTLFFYLEEKYGK